MRRTEAANCPAEATIGVIGGRWKVPIIWHLFAGTRRFSELRRAMPAVTQKMLTQQLRELERDGVVARKVYPQVPPKVEYSLTPLGRELGPLLDSMSGWGRQVIDGRAGTAGRFKARTAVPPQRVAHPVRAVRATTAAAPAGRR